jgi:hypothetical protein
VFSSVYIPYVFSSVGLFIDLVGKPEGKRPLRRPRRRWEDNIRLDIREAGWECVDWIRIDGGLLLTR